MIKVELIKKQTEERVIRVVPGRPARDRGVAVAEQSEYFASLFQHSFEVTEVRIRVVRYEIQSVQTLGISINENAPGKLCSHTYLPDLLSEASGNVREIIDRIRVQLLTEEKAAERGQQGPVDPQNAAVVERLQEVILRVEESGQDLGPDDWFVSLVQQALLTSLTAILNGPTKEN